MTHVYILHRVVHVLCTKCRQSHSIHTGQLGRAGSESYHHFARNLSCKWTLAALWQPTHDKCICEEYIAQWLKLHNM